MDQQQPHTTPGSSERFVIAHKMRLLRVLAVITVLALAAVAAFYILQQQEAVRQARQEAEQATNQAVLLQEALDAANSDEIAAAANKAEEVPNFGTFLAEYQKIQGAGVAIEQADVEDIGSALQEYYQLSALPDGWAVLAVYQITKPDTPPSGDSYALVYWPESDQKPAGFISAVKPADGEWQYHEQL